MLRHELLTNSAYHKRTELGSSTLKKLDEEGPAYVAAMASNPTPKSEATDSRALVVGSAVHAIMDGTFEDSFLVAPDSYKTAESDKFATLAEENFQLTSKQTLTAREWHEANKCGMSLRDAVGRHLVGRRKLHEPSIFWKQETPEFIVPCKCRPDLLVDDGSGGVLYLEIKTTAANGERAWRQSCWKYGYWLQQAHYEAGIIAAGAASVRTIFVVVRKSTPYDVRFYEFDGDDKSNAYCHWMALVNEYGSRCARHDWTADDLTNPTRVSLGLTNVELTEVDDG